MPTGVAADGAARPLQGADGVPVRRARPHPASRRVRRRTRSRRRPAAGGRRAAVIAATASAKPSSAVSTKRRRGSSASGSAWKRHLLGEGQRAPAEQPQHPELATQGGRGDVHPLLARQGEPGRPVVAEHHVGAAGQPAPLGRGGRRAHARARSSTSSRTWAGQQRRRGRARPATVWRTQRRRQWAANQAPAGSSASRSGCSRAAARARRPACCAASGEPGDACAPAARRRIAPAVSRTAGILPACLPPRRTSRPLRRRSGCAPGGASGDELRDLAPGRRLRLQLGLAAVERHAAGAEDFRVLDAGSEEGLLCLKLARRHPRWSLVAADIAEEPLRRGREWAREQGLAVQFVRCDLTAPSGDGVFDAVVALESLVEIPDDRAALRRMAQALRPGGRPGGPGAHRDWTPVLPERRAELAPRGAARLRGGRPARGPRGARAGGARAAADVPPADRAGPGRPGPGQAPGRRGPAAAAPGDGRRGAAGAAGLAWGPARGWFVVATAAGPPQPARPRGRCGPGPRVVLARRSQAPGQPGEQGGPHGRRPTAHARPRQPGTRGRPAGGPAKPAAGTSRRGPRPPAAA